MMRHLSLVVLIPLLAACSTRWAPIGDAPKPAPTPSMMERCPDALPVLDIPQERWDAMTGREQVQAMVNLAAADWAVAYHKCRLTHNSLVEYLEQ